MSFDLERFRGTALAPRQAAVPVPDLAAFFADGTDPVWTVRGLTGEEIARSNESSARSASLVAAIQALANSAALKDEKVEALQSVLGYGCLLYTSRCV